jgi:hypothetical protein
MTVLGEGTLGAGYYQDIPYILTWGITYTLVVQVADPNAQFDMDLFDQNRNLVDTSPVVGVVCGCQVTPKWTGPFTVRVKCLSGYSAYRLISEP